MIEVMAAIHMSEAELARDLHTVLEEVRLGREVVVEQDHHPVAVMKPAIAPARTLSEIITAMEFGKTVGVVDENFARDVEEGIAHWNEPWNPPVWD